MCGCWTFKKCIYLPIQTAEEELQVEGTATGALTNPSKSLNCFCSHQGFLSLASLMCLVSCWPSFGNEKEKSFKEGILPFPLKMWTPELHMCSQCSNVSVDRTGLFSPIIQDHLPRDTSSFPSPSPSPLSLPLSLALSLPPLSWALSICLESTEKLPPQSFLHSPHGWLQASGYLPIHSLLTQPVSFAEEAQRTLDMEASRAG